MARNAWLTPDSIPSQTVCRTLTMPADYAGIVACISGALYSLTLPENWEQFGAVTPQEMADAMLTMYLAWSSQPGECEPMADTTPIGAMVAWLGSDTSIPTNWLRANGNPVDIADYPDLYAAIGDTYGTSSPPVGQFYLPDMRGRSVMGEAGSVGARGDRLGELTHTLTASEMPVHSHTQRYSNTGSGGGTRHQAQGSVATIQTEALNTGDSGSGVAHNNLHPVVLMNYIIKAL